MTKASIVKRKFSKIISFMLAVIMTVGCMTVISYANTQLTKASQVTLAYFDPVEEEMNFDGVDTSNLLFSYTGSSGDYASVSGNIDVSGYAGKNIFFKLDTVSTVAYIKIPARPVMPVVSVNYTTEIASVSTKMQYSTDDGDNWTDCSAVALPLTDYLNGSTVDEVLVRLAPVGDISDSAASARRLASTHRVIPVERPDAPVVSDGSGDNFATAVSGTTVNATTKLNNIEARYGTNPYTAFTTSKTYNLTAALNAEATELDVRYKATAASFASKSATFTFSSGGNAPATPVKTDFEFDPLTESLSRTGGLIDGKPFQYSINDGSTWLQSSGNVIPLTSLISDEADSDLLIRVAPVGLEPPSGNLELTLEARPDATSEITLDYEKGIYDSAGDLTDFLYRTATSGAWRAMDDDVELQVGKTLYYCEPGEYDDDNTTITPNSTIGNVVAPTRPAAPTSTSVKVVLADGVITGLKTTMEYQFVTTTSNPTIVDTDWVTVANEDALPFNSDMNRKYIAVRFAGNTAAKKIPSNTTVISTLIPEVLTAAPQSVAIDYEAETITGITIASDPSGLMEYSVVALGADPEKWISATNAVKTNGLSVKSYLDGTGATIYVRSKATAAASASPAAKFDIPVRAAAPTGLGYNVEDAKLTSASAALSTLEYKNANAATWTLSDANGTVNSSALSNSGNTSLQIRIAAVTDTSFASNVASLIIYGKQDTPTHSFNYSDEKITVTPGTVGGTVEYKFGSAAYADAAGGIITVPATVVNGDKLYIRTKANALLPASADVEITIVRAAAPSVSFVPADLLFKLPIAGSITAATAIQYKESTAIPWLACTASTLPIIALADLNDKTFEFRVAPTATAFGSDIASVVVADMGSAIKEILSGTYTIDYANEKVTLLANTEYKLSAAATSWTKVTDATPVTLASLGYDGTEMTITYRACATGQNLPSDPVALTVPARLAAPTATIDYEAETVAIPAGDIQYKTATGAWTDGTTTSVAITDAMFGTTISVRTKAVVSSAFASEAATVVIPDRQAAPVASSDYRVVYANDVVDILSASIQYKWNTANPTAYADVTGGKVDVALATLDDTLTLRKKAVVGELFASKTATVLVKRAALGLNDVKFDAVNLNFAVDNGVILANTQYRKKTTTAWINHSAIPLNYADIFTGTDAPDTPATYEFRTISATGFYSNVIDVTVTKQNVDAPTAAAAYEIDYAAETIKFLSGMEYRIKKQNPDAYLKADSTGTVVALTTALDAGGVTYEYRKAATSTTPASMSAEVELKREETPADITFDYINETLKSTTSRAMNTVEFNNVAGGKDVNWTEITGTAKQLTSLIVNFGLQPNAIYVRVKAVASASFATAPRLISVPARSGNPTYTVNTLDETITITDTRAVQYSFDTNYTALAANAPSKVINIPAAQADDSKFYVYAEATDYTLASNKVEYIIKRDADTAVTVEFDMSKPSFVLKTGATLTIDKFQYREKVTGGGAENAWQTLTTNLFAAQAAKDYEVRVAPTATKLGSEMDEINVDQIVLPATPSGLTIDFENEKITLSDTDHEFRIVGSTGYATWTKVSASIDVSLNTDEFLNNPAFTGSKLEYRVAGTSNAPPSAIAELQIPTRPNAPVGIYYNYSDFKLMSLTSGTTLYKVKGDANWTEADDTEKYEETPSGTAVVYQFANKFTASSFRSKVMELTLNPKTPLNAATEVVFDYLTDVANDKVRVKMAATYEYIVAATAPNEGSARDTSTIAGNPTGDGTSAIVVTTAEQTIWVRAKGSVGVPVSEWSKVTIKAQLAAPTGVGIDYSGSNLNGDEDKYENIKLTGVANGMQYSLNGGTNWFNITGTTAIIADEVSPSTAISIRINATQDTPMSASATVTSATIKDTSEASLAGVDELSGTYGTIKGLTTAMEYSINGKVWKQYTGVEMLDLTWIADGTVKLKVRIKATVAAPPSKVKEITLSAMS